MSHDNVRGHPPRALIQIEPLSLSSTQIVLMQGAVICKRLAANKEDNGLDHLMMAVSHEILKGENSNG